MNRHSGILKPLLFKWTQTVYYWKKSDMPLGDREREKNATSSFLK